MGPPFNFYADNHNRVPLFVPACQRLCRGVIWLRLACVGTEAPQPPRIELRLDKRLPVRFVTDAYPYLLELNGPPPDRMIGQAKNRLVYMLTAIEKEELKRIIGKYVEQGRCVRPIHPDEVLREINRFKLMEGELETDEGMKHRVQEHNPAKSESSA